MKRIRNVGLFFAGVVLLFFVLIGVGGMFMSSRTSVVLDTPIEAPFLDAATDKKAVLLYFGFVGCDQVCVPFLESLHQFYLRNENITVPLVFINMLEGATSSDAHQFAAFFNPEFMGISLERETLLRIQKAFHLYVTPSLFDGSKLNHTDFLYLLVREEQGWLIKSFYLTSPLDEGTLLQHIKELP